LQLQQQSNATDAIAGAGPVQQCRAGVVEWVDGIDHVNIDDIDGTNVLLCAFTITAH